MAASSGAKRTATAVSRGEREGPPASAAPRITIGSVMTHLLPRIFTATRSRWNPEFSPWGIEVLKGHDCNSARRGVTEGAAPAEPALQMQLARVKRSQFAPSTG